MTTSVTLFLPIYHVDDDGTDRDPEWISATLDIQDEYVASIVSVSASDDVLEILEGPNAETFRDALKTNAIELYHAPVYGD